MVRKVTYVALRARALTVVANGVNTSVSIVSKKFDLLDRFQSIGCDMYLVVVFGMSIQQMERYRSCDEGTGPRYGPSDEMTWIRSTRLHG